MEPKGISGLLSPYIKRIRIKAALEYIKEGMDILDIGSGFGEIINLLPENANYTGIEKDEYLFNYCKNKYPEKKFIQADAEEIVEDLREKFDIILLLSVLEHLKNPLKLLNSLSEKLKKNGRIIIYAPSPKAKYPIKIFSKLGILSKSAEEEHQNFFNLKDLEENLKNTGLKIIKCKNFFFGLTYLLVLEKFS